MVAVLDERNCSLVATRGITVPELYRRVLENVHTPHSLTASALARWLVTEELATMQGDELVPTVRGLEAGGPLG